MILTVNCINPPLDLKLEPIIEVDGKENPHDFKKRLNISTPNDKEVINASIKCNNHWYKGVKWIEFHQNQIMQYVVDEHINSLKFSSKVILKQETLKLPNY